MSFWRTYYHMVWATRNRRPLIDVRLEPTVFSYLEKKAGEFSVLVYAINGIEDHVHLVVAIPPRFSVSEVVKALKGGSSHYLNHYGHSADFEWHRGYGVFTLGERQLTDAVAYVRAQKEHHRVGRTNIWLERVDEVDDGSIVSSVSIREPGVMYQIIKQDERPF